MCRLLPCALAVGLAAVLCGGTADAQVVPPGDGPSAAPRAGASAGAPPPAEALPSRPIYGTMFGLAQLRDLPSSRSLWSLIETADAMMVADRIDNGGLYVGEVPRIGSFGASWTQVSYAMDGVDVTDPERTGTPLLNPDSQVLQTVAVSSAYAPIDFTGSGPVVRLTPRRPGDNWTGTLQLSLVPHALQADASDGGVPSIARFGSAKDGSLLLGGPLVPKRFSLLVSGRLAAARRFERSDPTALDNRLTSLFAHGVYTASPDSLLRLVASVDSAVHPFDGRARFADRNVRGRATYWHVHGVWERLTSVGSTFTASAAYQRGVFGGPENGPARTVATMERLSDGPVPALMTPDSAVRERLDASLRVNWLPGGPNSRHLVMGGLSINRSSATTEGIGAADIGETVDGLPARIWRYSFAGPTSRREIDLSAWVDARLALPARVGLDLATRFESTHGTSDAGASIVWNTVTPRVAVRWAMTPSGSVSAYFGYGLQRIRMPLDYLDYGDPGGLSAQVVRWNDLNHDGLVQPAEYGRLISIVGPGGGTSSIDPGLRAPLSDEFTVGFQARFGPKWQARLGAIDRLGRSFVQPVNVGVTLADYSLVQVFDQGVDFVSSADDRYLTVYNRRPASFGRDRYLLTNPADDDGRFLGLDCALERIFDGRWHMLIGASAHRSDGTGANRGFRADENDVGVLGEAFVDPNAVTYDRGRLFFDRGYVLKWSAGGVLVNDVYLGAVARYQDGQHFAREVIVPDLNQGPEAIQAYTRGRSRFMYTFTLDARIEKGWRVGSRRMAVVLEGFNLLNTGNEVEEVVVTTRNDFRAPTAVEPPRVFRLGLRVDF